MEKNIKMPSQTVRSVNSAPKLTNIIQIKPQTSITRCAENNNIGAFPID